MKALFIRVLTTNIAAKLTSDQVFAFSTPMDNKAAVRVIGAVQVFDVTHSGEAILEVQWMLKDPTSKTLFPANNDRYQLTGINPEDFESRAQALSDLLEYFANDIASALASVP